MAASDLRPTIESVRLRAEPVEKRHAAEMTRVLSDPSIYLFLEDEPPTLERLESQYEYLTSGLSPDGSEHWLTWVVRLKGDGPSQAIGFVQATIKEPESVTLAYVLAPTHWKKGYAREAVSALLDVVFERYRVNQAIVQMDTRNTRSIALVEALGFRHQGTVRDAAVVKGTVSHEHVYTLDRDTWCQRPSEAGRDETGNSMG